MSEIHPSTTCTASPLAQARVAFYGVNGRDPGTQELAAALRAVGIVDPFAAAPSPDRAGDGGDLGEQTGEPLAGTRYSSETTPASSRGPQGEYPSRDARHPWCQPGDDPKRRFVVQFDDPDQGHAVFDNEDEARQYFEQATLNWNCYLLAALPRDPSSGFAAAIPSGGMATPSVLWSAWSETDADSDPSDPGVTYCTEWFIGRWSAGAEEPECRVLIGEGRSAEIIAHRVAGKLTSILNTDRLRSGARGWRADCFRTRMEAFDYAYKKACESSQPRHWMDAALLAQQFRNVAYAVLTGEAPRQEPPASVGWVLVPREPDDKMVQAGGSMLTPTHWLTDCYDYFREAWEAALDARPIPPASCVEHPLGEDAPVAAELRSDASAVDEVQTPQVNPNPHPAPMTVEEAREVLNSFDRDAWPDPTPYVQYLRKVASDVPHRPQYQQSCWTFASRIETALRTLSENGEAR